MKPSASFVSHPSRVFTGDLFFSGVRAGLVNMTRSVQQEFPQEFQNVLSGLPQEHAHVLMTAVNMQSPS